MYDCSVRVYYIAIHHIASSFEGGNFPEYHKSVVVRENFTLEIFNKKIYHQPSVLDNL